MAHPSNKRNGVSPGIWAKAPALAQMIKTVIPSLIVLLPFKQADCRLGRHPHQCTRGVRQVIFR
jgi:hypothetical protein